VSYRNSYIGYYDLRVPLAQSKGDESPWDKVMRAFKALMTEIWAADPSTKVFVYLPYWSPPKTVINGHSRQKMTFFAKISWDVGQEH
jgi:hypothetical protein